MRPMFWIWMGFFALIGFILGLMLPSGSAKADYVIRSIQGGTIGNFEYEFKPIALSGERVRVEGDCLSGCTIVLQLPKDRLCVGPHARFGFHAAWSIDGQGRKVESKPGTAVLRSWYPPAITRWINRHGGLQRQMIFLQGKALSALYPQCPLLLTAEPSTEAFADINGVLRLTVPLLYPPIRGY